MRNVQRRAEAPTQKVLERKLVGSGFGGVGAELKNYYVYILTNARHSVLYVGVTSNLAARLHQHESLHSKSFTARYRVHLLVYFEVYSSPQAAIDREKQLKAGSREDKLRLINTTNPDWRALRPDGSPLDE